ncbi:DUF6794 domain-containing protein [Xanthocytophaga agilis]|uniref:DUF6794 domain-containing protein n=1 Tax=Xanthocytophaga agilis TaxID=3048010 RepID=A0AAE3QWP1_9BACT|nr:DUF6794 domain-containing protein [Xanthocytophaga agilis]MDJ1499454.1 hypothetical protein [Xanthocytophaga agilis]
MNKVVSVENKNTIRSCSEDSLRKLQSYKNNLLEAYHYRVDCGVFGILREKKVYLREDIYHFLLLTFHRYLNGYELDTEGQFEYYNTVFLRKEEERKRRMEQDTINGVYIPKDLQDCFRELDKKLTAEEKNQIASLASVDDLIAYHRGLGMWIRNAWGLWGGSRLLKYFKDTGFEFVMADDLSVEILIGYYKYLQQKTKP